MFIPKLFAATLFFPFMCIAGSSEGNVLRLAAATQSQLPDFLGSQEARAWSFDLTTSGASLSFAHPREQWEAQLDGGTDGISAFHFAHVIRLNDRLGAGGRFQHEDGLSDLFVNAVYAAKKNLRYRIAASQRRIAPESELGAPVTHQSVLVSIKKRWDQRFWTDAGLHLFAIEAQDRSQAPLALIGEDREYHPLFLRMRQKSGKMHGIGFDFGVRPIADTRLEFKYEFTNTVHFDDRVREDELNHHQGTVRLLHDLDACGSLSSALTGSSETTGIELTVSRRNWSIQAWSGFGSEAAKSVTIGYTISFDGPKASTAQCAPLTANRPFEPLIEALGNPPQQLFYEPLS